MQDQEVSVVGERERQQAVGLEKEMEKNVTVAVGKVSNVSSIWVGHKTKMFKCKESL
jgi:hypothetical protein